MNHWNGRTERSNRRKPICVALLESLLPVEVKRERRRKEERWKVRMRAREER